MRTSFFSFVSFFVAVARGQQLITTTNALGATIIEQLTSDALGNPITQILQTIASVAATTSPSLTLPGAPTTTPLSTTASTTSSTPLTTTPTPVAPVQQGPVGQPAPTPTAAQGETPYTYTTTDAQGDTTVVADIFTPSFPASSPINIPATGTILDYSQWLSSIGNATSMLNKPVGTQILSAGTLTSPLSIVCTLLACVAAGIMLVLV